MTEMKSQLTHSPIKINKIAYLGLFSAIALILSFVESLIPFSFGIPGIKLGLANLMIVIALYVFDCKDALIINLVRIVLAGFLFGNMYSLIYSLAGALLSFIFMLLFKKIKYTSPIGVSLVGAVFHNIGQLLVAIFVVENYYVGFYVPYLLLAGLFTGILIGIISGIIIPKFRRLMNVRFC